MKCIACDKLLSNFESTRKSLDTKEYLDLCSKCYRESGLALNDEELDSIETESIVEKTVSNTAMDALLEVYENVWSSSNKA